LADGHSLAIGQLCDKGTATGGYVISWLTERILHMKLQARASRRDCQIGPQWPSVPRDASVDYGIGQVRLAGKTPEVHPIRGVWSLLASDLMHTVTSQFGGGRR
jgi:hypothetical protein